MKRLFYLLAWAFLCVLPHSLTGQQWSMTEKLGSSDQEAADNLGISVAIAGNYMAAGAWWEEGELGSNVPINTSGAVYIYEKQLSGEWIEVQKLVSEHRESLGYYGFDVAISGSYLLVGAYNEDHSGHLNAGRVYAYHRTTQGEWILDDILMTPDAENADYFGFELAMTDDYALIGAYRQPLDENGNNHLNAAGAAYLYKRQNDNKWQLIRKLVAPDREANDNFGKYLDIHTGGLVIGAYKKSLSPVLLESGAAYGYSCNGDCDFDAITSADLKQFTPMDQTSLENFGLDVAIDGNWVAAGKVFEKEQPGGGVGGNTGAVYFYYWENGDWIQKQKVYASDFGAQADFGGSISMDGPVCVIGAAGEAEDAHGENTIFFSGAAYVFERQPNDQWEEVEKIAGTERAYLDLFGSTVGVSGTHTVVGAWLADSISNDYMVDRGAIYVFERDDPISASSSYILQENNIRLENPSAGNLNLISEAELFQSGQILVKDIHGKTVLNESIQFQTYWQRDLSRLNTGTYIVQFEQTGFRPQILKWIKI